MKIKILQAINLTYTGKPVRHEKGEILDIDKKVAEKLSLVNKYKEYPHHIEIIEDEIKPTKKTSNDKMK